jgi:hypothetical protein
MLEQNQVLMLGLHLVEHPLDRVGHAKAARIEQRLGNPAFLRLGALSRATAGQVPAVATH